jgi:hypothetical protein
VHPNLTLTLALPQLAVYLRRIIGCPVPNSVYGLNNPLGNECQNEIVGDVLNYTFRKSVSNPDSSLLHFGMSEASVKVDTLWNERSEC